MADQTIKATEEMVGSGHPTKADTLNRLTLVEHNTDGTHDYASAAEIIAGTEAAKVIAPDQLLLAGIGVPGNWKQTTGTFTATPASTSTITMTTDMTASIKAGMSLKYVIAAVTYYGRVAAIAANLLTVNGAPLGANVTALYYGGGIISQLAYDASVNVDGSANTTVLLTGTVFTIRWKKPTSYLVGYEAYQTTHDSGTHGKVTVKINGTEVNTSAGGLVIAANATWYSTVVDIDVAAYDVNNGEDVTFVVTQGSTVNGAGLRMNVIFVTP